VDSTTLRYVLNTSHIKWKEWKADLEKTRFDASLTDEQLYEKNVMIELVKLIGRNVLNIGDLLNLK
jgi:hypothetical protein